MWVIAGGMPRSGSTLQYQMACEIVERCRLGVHINRKGKRQMMYDQQMQQSEMIFVTKSHRVWDYIDQALPTAKVIYVCRDIRDVIASVMVKSDQSFQAVMSGGLPDMAIAEYYKWMQARRLWASKYEVMYADPVAEVIKIMACVEAMPRSKTLLSFATEVAEYLSIENQIARREKRDEKPTRHISPMKGKPGQYKVILSPAEIKETESRYGDWLRMLGYLET